MKQTSLVMKGFYTESEKMHDIYKNIGAIWGLYDIIKKWSWLEEPNL